MKAAKVIDEGNEDIYRFGLECLLLKLVHYTSYLCIGIALHMLFPLIVSALTLMPFRSMAGGYHAKTRTGCYIFSCLVVFLVCILNKFVLPEEISIAILCMVNSITWIFAPTDNDNRKLTYNEKQKFKKKALMILGAGDVAVFLAMFNELQLYQWLLNGLAIAAVLIPLGKIQKANKFTG